MYSVLVYTFFLILKPLQLLDLLLRRTSSLVIRKVSDCMKKQSSWPTKKLKKRRAVMAIPVGDTPVLK